MIKLINMSLYKTKAIILGSRPFDESAKLVEVLSYEHGKISMIAKGAKRLASRFGGKLETFNYVELLLARGRNLDILSQIEILDTFNMIRKDILRINLGFYFLKVINASTLKGQKNQKLFKLLLLALKKMSDGEKLEYVVKFFEVNLLKAEGIYRRDILPEDMISLHLDKDIKQWKKKINVTGL